LGLIRGDKLLVDLYVLALFVVKFNFLAVFYKLYTVVETSLVYFCKQLI
jgi:hypothetical protein